MMLSPSTGILSVDNVDVESSLPLDVEVELTGFTPTSTVGPGNLQGSSTPSPSTQSPQVGYNIFDDTELLGMPGDPGSDMEVDDEAIMLIESVDLADLPLNLTRMLNEIDIRDDEALRAEATDLDMLNFNWSSNPENFVGQKETFLGEAGPTFSLEGLSPLDVFRRIWDNHITDVIVQESNRYGQQLYAKANKLWADINVTDIWVFFALLMLQSILILSVEKEYWYPCLAFLKVGDFQKIMPYKKFLRIKRCLHFVDNTVLTTATGDNRKLKKIWPVIEHLNTKFSSLYLPEQHIAIDESLLLWKGRLSFVQLIATKAARVGIKSYELCESRTGYLWKMIVYTGKGDKSAQPAQETDDSNEPEGVTSKIVYNLVRPLLNKGHTLVMDNFYNSPLLSRSLKSKKTDTMGTLRLNRAFVPETLKKLSKSNTRPGEVVYSQTEDLTISVWHDSSLVSLISTYHPAAVGGKEKYGTYKYKPQALLDYNMSMGGIDKKDQMLTAFPLERVRNLMWYKKVFRRLLNVSIHNAFIIYNHHNKNVNQRHFRVALAREILEKMQVPDPQQEIRTGHYPEKNALRRQRCKLCFQKKLQKRTAYKCDTCSVNLCIEGCFREYHLMMI